MMMSFDFQVTIDLDGFIIKFPFVMTAVSFAVAVNKAITIIMKENRTARFDGLTYYHPPLK